MFETATTAHSRQSGFGIARRPSGHRRRLTGDPPSPRAGTTRFRRGARWSSSSLPCPTLSWL